MEIDSDDTLLPRFFLEKSVVASPPRQSSVADLSNNGTHDSDGGDHPILEYVIQLERSCDEALLAAALSSREIKIYARDSMELSGNLTGQKGALTQLAFSPKDCHGLFSASEDGTVRAWDTRSLRSTSKFGQSGEEIWSIGLGYDGHLCAAGKSQTIDFYDLRKTGKKLRTYEDCHTDAITQLRFHPVKHSFLLTASEDGLMCYYDTAVPSEEDALDSVLNAECAVRNAGFFGPEGECVYCCSNTETLSIWHAADAQRIVDYGDIRAVSRGQSLASSGEGKAEGSRGDWGFDVDYIVGCRYEGEGDKLWLVTGGFEGGACLATVSPDSITPEAMLSGGHSEQIRTFDWLGGSLATGGEDAKISLWRMPNSEVDDEMVEGSGLSKDDGSRRDGMEENGEGTAHLTSARRRAENRSGRMFRPYSSDDRRR